MDDTLRAKFPSNPGKSRGALATTFIAMCAGLGAAACGRPSTEPVGNGGQEIIGGFVANDPALDAIGSLAVHFDFGSPLPGGAPAQELCGATLIGPETVLTAKHCAQIVPLLVSLGARLTYGVGPKSVNPKREVNIASLELAPGDLGGFVGVGHDVSVMHLETPITDISPVDLGVLTDDQIGQPFAAIGYGIQDNTGANGTRRLGKQTLRSREGRVFEAMFGTFDNFFDWFKDGTAPLASLAKTDGGGAGVGGGGGDGAASGASEGTGGAGGTDGVGGAGGQVRPGVDGGPIFPPPPSLEDFARQIYDTTLLDAGYEVVTGGAPGDAQPCFGDSGSSLILRKQGKFISFGVVSGGIGSRDSLCDLGTVYATFGAGVLEFLDTAKQWTDPCGDIDTNGTCDGNTATRCTNLVEGRRRLVSFDCGSLEMTCNMLGGQVSCDGNSFGPQGPPSPPPPKGNPRAEVDKVFMSPDTLVGRFSHP
jgi:hypothetical protein